jgi:FdhE protein
MQPYSDDHIRGVLLSLQRDKPAYGELLGVYRELFLAQNRLAAQPEPLDLSMDRNAAHQRLRDGFSLFTPETFPLDPEAYTAFLRTVCDLVETAPDTLARCAGQVADALSKEALDMAALGYAILMDDEQGLARFAADMDMDAGAFRFLLTNALIPLAARYAKKAATLLTDGPSWERGRCPICGHLPSLSALSDKGIRTLICAFCQHQWTVPRIFCPACETRANDASAYFFSQEEAEYRVYTCDNCRFYLKTVDLSLLRRAFYPPVEVLLTLHLDIQAQEQGYTAEGARGTVGEAVGSDDTPN